MRSIYLDIAGKMHSLYNELINYPPDGYQFVSDKTCWTEISKNTCKINAVYDFQRKILNNIVPVNLVKSYTEQFKKIPDYVDLTYSSGHLIFRSEPWIVDLEFVTHLAGYNYNHFKRYRKIIENALKSENCKKIMPWTEAGKKTIFLTINNDEILDKVETVHLAVHGKKFVKQYNVDKIKLLFVSSANIPKDFDIKGGKEVLEAFSKLNDEYDNLELIIRSYVPPHVKEKYKSTKNIRIIDEIIPWDDLEKEFKSADIFLFPAHHTPGLAILDAMSYELPVITTDVWANSEQVTDCKTGFLIKKSEYIRYCTDNFIPDWTSPENLKKIKRDVDPTVVNELIEKTRILIESDKLRKKMGEAGRKEIEYGKYSIENRNKKLGAIFEDASQF